MPLRFFRTEFHPAIAAGALAAVLAAQAPLPAQASSFTTLYSFPTSADGEAPQASLVSIGGTLYGVTKSGGANNFGTLFSFNPTTKTKTTLLSFGGSNPGLFPIGIAASGKVIYGVTLADSVVGGGLLFSYATATGKFTALHSFAANAPGGSADGNTPNPALVISGGTIYGTTEYGGSGNCSDGCGTVFAYRLATKTETIPYAFDHLANADGIWPVGGLVTLGGTLYGLTSEGGNGNDCCGIVFSFAPASSAETKLYVFNPQTEGIYPDAQLTAAAGTLYGSTGQGNPYYGSIFSVAPASGVETPLHNFTVSSSGFGPVGPVAVDGKIVLGTTSGATTADGVVYSYNVATKAYTVIHGFTGGTDGYSPTGLVKIGTSYYGTTQYGGLPNGCNSSGCGTIFTVTP